MAIRNLVNINESVEVSTEEEMKQVIAMAEKEEVDFRWRREVSGSKVHYFVAVLSLEAHLAFDLKTGLATEI